VAAFTAGALVARLRGRETRHAEGRAPPEVLEYMTHALHEANEQLARLRTVLEQQDAEMKRLRRLSQLGRAQGLEAVVEQVLEAGLELSKSDAAITILRENETDPRLFSRGLSPDEDPRAVVGMPASRGVRSMSLGYEYGSGTPSTGELGTGVVLPLRADGEGDGDDLGLLAVFRRAPRAPYVDEDVGMLEELAGEAVSAILSARVYEDMKQSAIRDGLTSLYNRTFFHQQLVSEVRRARRYDRPLALIVFDLDDFKSVNKALGHLEADAVLGEVAVRLNASVRRADIPARVGGDEFAVIMPESRPRDARHLFERVQTAVSSAPTLTGVQVSFSAGIAALQPDDDARSLFSSADRAAEEAKRLGKGQCRTAAESVREQRHDDDDEERKAFP